jgi:hypothetical protein
MSKYSSLRIIENLLSYVGGKMTEINLGINNLLFAILFEILHLKRTEIKITTDHCGTSKLKQRRDEQLN